MVDFLKHIYIVGAGSSFVIGFFLAMVLMRQKRRNPRSNLLMGSLLIVLACSMALNAYLEAVIPNSFPFLRTLPEPFLLLIGPLFHEYIHRLAGSQRRLSRAALHVLPFVLVAGGLTLVMIGSYDVRPRRMAYGVGAVWLLIYIHFWVYYYLNRKTLRLYQAKLKASHSMMEGVYQSWISYCLNALLVCYSVLGLLFLLQHGHIYLPINRSLAVVLAVMIYCIGYRILVQPELFTLSAQPGSPPETDHEEMNANGRTKYQKSGLQLETAADEGAKVIQFMETRKPHVQPELDLKKLAEMLDLSPHHLSQIINTELATNFYDFVNGYRVEEAKSLLSDRTKEHLSVIHIAFDAGFNSKATFNRMFKKITQKTPSQFRREQTRD